MSVASQIAVLAAVNLRSIPKRPGNSLVIVIGMAGVVAVFVSVLAMSLGFRATLSADASDHRAVVFGRYAESEDASSITRATLSKLQELPGILQLA